MASSMIKFYLKSLRNTNQKLNVLYTVIRHSSIPPKVKTVRGTIKHRNLIKSSCESLAARGFLRSLKPYTPEKNVTEKISGICQAVLGKGYKPESVLSRENKFALLNACFQELNYSVPNSQLHRINSVNDVIEFYKTPVCTTTPYDELKNQELPPNLHIQYDYLRFNSETDTKFKGISAYPQSSTIVTGLKYKNKYEQHKEPLPLYYGMTVNIKK